MNVHFYDPESDMVYLRNLCCSEKTDRHYAINIEKWFEEVMEEFEITKDQILSITIDSGANITKAVKNLITNCEKSTKILNSEVDLQEFDNFDDEHSDDDENDDYEDVNEESDDEDELKIKSVDGKIVIPSLSLFDVPVMIHCGAHKHQLSLNDFFWWEKKSRHVDKKAKKGYVLKVAVKDRNPTKIIIKKAQKIAAKLRTQVAKCYLNEENSSFLSPLQDQPTRWNSTFHMLERLLVLKDFCIRNEKQSFFKGEKFKKDNVEKN